VKKVFVLHLNAPKMLSDELAAEIIIETLANRNEFAVVDVKASDSSQRGFKGVLQDLTERIANSGGEVRLDDIAIVYQRACRILGQKPLSLASSNADSLIANEVRQFIAAGKRLLNKLNS